MSETRTVVLVGASGSGRTSVGARVAADLGLPFVEVEDVVASRRGVPYGDLVLLSDEHLGAEVEEVALSLLDGRPGVVTLVPGALTDEVLARLDEVRADGARVVLLAVDVAEVSRREGLNAPRSVGLGAPRALLARFIADLEARLAPHVDVVVNTVGREVGAVADEVRASL